jgi:hypothetical protein
MNFLVSLLFLKGKERLVDGFTAADRALARLLETFAFVKDKPALRALSIGLSPEEMSC